MADAPVVHIGENSPEQVAHTLMREIALVEQKSISSGQVQTGWTKADRKYILDTYAECLNAVKNPEGRVTSIQR